MGTFSEIQKIVAEIKNELNSYYPSQEVQSFIFLLFQHFLNYSKTDLLGEKEKEIRPGQKDQLWNAVEELKKNKPIQYILGETLFYNLHFSVNPSVLIPRPETEELVQSIIQNNSKSNSKILDIGTGSGCIAIALAKYIPDSEVFAVDISEEVLKLASTNAVKNEVIVNFKEMDILSVGGNDLPLFDIIVSNPPYIPLHEKDNLPDNVKLFEPSVALFVENKNPLHFYEAIISFSSKQLNREGWIYFEIHEEYGDNLVELLEKKSFFNITLCKDINGKNRVIRAQNK